jgi:hypothetical protein
LHPLGFYKINRKIIWQARQYLAPVGAYGLIDLGVGIITGTSLTDRIGTIVDEEIQKNKKIK